VKVVGTSVDPVARLRTFRDKYDLRFPLVSDHSRSIGDIYGTLKGGLSSTHERDTLLIGREVTILAAYQGVSAKGHAAAVLAEIKSLRARGDL
jgi:peroxiredoxin Q/BCP